MVYGIWSLKHYLINPFWLCLLQSVPCLIMRLYLANCWKTFCNLLELHPCDFSLLTKHLPSDLKSSIVD